MPDKLIKLFSTWFYIGNFPAGPGTLASAVTVLLVIICSFNIYLYVAVMIAVTVLGFLVSGKMEALLGKKDPSCIVIDEVAGIMISFILLPLSPKVILTAFFLFRAFDMFKIYPANKFEGLGGGAGVMIDDVMAGIYTNLTMQVAIRWAGIL